MLFIQATQSFAAEATIQESITVAGDNMLFLVAYASGQTSSPSTILYPTISDSKSNTYIYIGRYNFKDYYYVKFTKPGNTRITATYSSPVINGGFDVMEFSGGNTLDQVVYEQENLSVGTNTISLSTLAPTTVANEGILYLWNGFTANHIQDATYTQISAYFPDFPNEIRRAYLKNVTSTGIQNYTGYSNVESIGFEYWHHIMFTFSYEAPPPKKTGVKLRGKCQLRGNIKIQ